MGYNRLTNNEDISSRRAATQESIDKSRIKKLEAVNKELLEALQVVRKILSEIPVPVEWIVVAGPALAKTDKAITLAQGEEG